MNYPWQATVQDEQGNAVVNPVVTVWEADGVTLATIYDVTGAEIANPIPGSLEGFVQFWAAEGEYRIEGASGGQETDVWSWIAGPVASVRYDAAQTLTDPEKTQALSNIGAQPAGGYVRYDDAQSLSNAQQFQARTNIGAAKDITVTNISAANDVRFYADFTTANGEVWRYISGSIVKTASASADHVVVYGFNFISQTFPVATSGDAIVGDIFCMTYNNLAGSTTITARNDDGTMVTNTYRANWNVFGRIL